MKIRHTQLVGLGGTGGWLAEPAARLLKHHPEAQPGVVLSDGDKFDVGNASRQATTFARGANKAKATKLRLAIAMDTRYIDASPFYVYEDDIQQLVANADYNFGVGPDDGVVCVILAVDNDFARAETILSLEASDHDYLIINPGNEFSTFTCSMAARIGGVQIGGSLLERYPQYSNPDPKVAPGHEGCLEKIPSEPQLITANLAAAAAALSVMECWLSDRNIPLALTGRTGGLSCVPEGAIALPGWEATSRLRGAV